MNPDEESISHLETPDLFLKGIQVTNSHLIKDYEKLLSLVSLHETELCLLWLGFGAILLYQINHQHKVNRLIKELYVRA